MKTKNILTFPTLGNDSLATTISPISQCRNEIILYFIKIPVSWNAYKTNSTFKGYFF